jgi:histidine triad (HIT) family protein
MMATSNDCIFCKLAAHQLPSNIIYEDENFMGFLDAFPSSLGHALVIPKQHYADIFEIPQDIGAALTRVVVRCAACLRTELGAPGMNILQNNGACAGQTVFHYHVHIIPRQEGDDISVRWRTTTPAKDESAALAQRLLGQMK